MRKMLTILSVLVLSLMLSNNTLQAKTIKDVSVNKTIKIEKFYNDKKTQAKLFKIIEYKNNKQKVVKKFKNKKLVETIYYYNIYDKKQPIHKKPFVTRKYNNKGKVIKTINHHKVAKQKAIVKQVKSKVGKKYRYGATGPNAYDCSGLVQDTMKKSINKNVGRTTGAQKNKGTSVAINTKKLQEGDMLFWGSKSNPYHSGVYIGGGKYVHAATSGAGVKVDTLKSYKPSFAKRVV